MAEPTNNYSKPEPEKPAVPRDQRPKIEKIVTGEVKTRKKPLYHRVIEYFAGEDMQSVGQYVLFEVILPSFKSLIFDAASQGLERRLFGNDRRNYRGTGNNYTPYNKTPNVITVVKGNGGQQVVQRGPIEKPLEMFQNIIVGTRAEAQSLLDFMDDYSSQYGSVTVADIYEAIGQKEAVTFTDVQWGWRTTRGCHIQSVNNGYLLNLTQPVALDQ